MKSFKQFILEKDDFEVTHEGWHGTPDVRGIREHGFKTMKQQHGVEDKESIFWATGSKHYKEAKTYADDHRAWDYQNAVPAVLPVQMSMKNPKYINWEGKSFRGRHKDGQGYAIQDHIDAARKAGHDGFVIHRVVDDYHAKGKPMTIMGVFDAKNIRVKPKQMNESTDDIDHELVQKAKDHFGITNDHREAGYIMHDGSMLDLSGRHQMQNDYTKVNGKWIAKKGRDFQQGVRYVDHRDLSDVEEGLSDTSGMHEFMHRTGALRHFPGVGFQANRMPNPKQIATAVAGHNRYHRGEPMQVDVHLGKYDTKSETFDRPNVEGVTKFLKKHLK